MASKENLRRVNAALPRVRNAAMLIAFIFYVLVFRPLAAQSTTDIAGNWQGTVQAGRGFRVILQVSKIAASEHSAGGWHGMFVSIDPGSGARSFDVQSLAVEGTAVRFVVPGISGSFDGKLSADGKSIAGTLKESAVSYQLTLERATDATAWEVPKTLGNMPADAKPEFEVATIKPTAPDWHRSGFMKEGRQISCENETVEDIIAFAYGIHKQQIAGGPDWLGKDRYTVDGVPDAVGEPNIRQIQGMYRALLVSRFNFAFHHEKRTLSVYVVRAGKNAPKISTSLGDPNGLPDMTFTEWNSQAIALRATNVTMADFVWNVGMTLDRPVVDESGLTGRYDFVLRWAPELAPANDTNGPPPLATAIQEQLGLKLDATKAPADVLVIDHIDRPSEN